MTSADSWRAAVVMPTVSKDVDELTVALREGACGYLPKNIEAEALCVALRKAAGEPVIADDITAKARRKHAAARRR
ncbi:hypothetical protein [Caballeronia sp. BCC1704]|uniref:hypothetical protein n=1 Tax=Caballeronia sp. BCC1704 TaxID=2676300 RepID=UPI00158CFBB0|nr:hypothetical protein [Caballeronia sp. BCC1704]